MVLFKIKSGLLIRCMYRLSLVIDFGHIRQNDKFYLFKRQISYILYTKIKKEHDHDDVSLSRLPWILISNTNKCLWKKNYFSGCFDVLVIPYGTIKNKNITIPDNSVEKCYLECQRENIKCGPTEPVYIAIKVTVLIIMIWVNVRMTFATYMYLRNIKSLFSITGVSWYQFCLILYFSFKKLTLLWK